jgi:hypothetical protein
MDFSKKIEIQIVVGSDTKVITASSRQELIDGIKNVAREMGLKTFKVFQNDQEVSPTDLGEEVTTLEIRAFNKAAIFTFGSSMQELRANQPGSLTSTIWVV